MTARISLVLTIILFVVISACQKHPQSPTTTAKPSSLVAEEQHHPEGGTTPAAEVKYFKGSIGTTLDLQMKLQRTGDQVTGNYFYRKIGTKIDLKGNVDKDGNVTLQEFDPSGKQTGLFKGIWKPQAEDGLITIAGNWSKPPGDKNAEKKTAFSMHEEPISFSGNVDVIIKQIKETNKKLNYEIEALYPQLSGSANPNAEKLNQLVRASVTKEVSDFKKEMAAPVGEGEQPPTEAMGSYINVAYSIALAQDDLVSLELDVNTYYRGAAHPNSVTEVVNYDLKNGRQLKLSDLFKPARKYLQAISAYCIGDLKKQSKAKAGMLDDSTIQSGAGPTPKNYQNWTVTRRGLGVNFNSYQVGPYAAGPQYVLVPFAVMKDLTNPDGPIAQFAK
ncbi:MAG: DUF3298 domain-containing protein [Pyrinomonadaceae bacterium]